MAEQQEQTVVVKVRAKRESGFIRAGTHWPATETYARVTEQQAKQLEAEPMLKVDRVSEGSVPEGQRATLQQADEKSPDEQRAEMVDEEFPQLAGRPGGPQTFVGAKDRSVPLAQGYATAPEPGQKIDPYAQEPAQPGGGGEQPPIPEGTPPPPKEEPDAQNVDLAAAAFASDPITVAEKGAAKKRRDQQ